MFATKPPKTEAKQPSKSKKIRVLSNHPLDIRLRELVAEACCYPAKSLGRRKALDRLVREVQASKKLFRGPGVTQAHYEEALSMTWLAILKNIEKYDSSQAEVMTWINMRLGFDIKTIQGKIAKEENRTVSPIAYEDGGTPIAIIDLQPAQRDPDWLLQQFYNWMAENRPDFEKIHIAHRPKLNCHQLFSLRLLNGETFEAIAKQFDSETSTVSSFWYNKCKPRLDDFGNNLL